MIKRSAAVVTLLLLLVAGCDGPPSQVTIDGPSAPLGPGGDQVVQCGPDPSGGIMTFGGTVLQNDSKGTVIIEGVSFYGDRQLKLLHSLIIPIRGHLIGVAYGWPPPRMNITQPGVQWSKRVQAIDARIPPSGTGSTQLNLVIAMLPTAHRAVAAGVQVRYREGGRQYEWRTHTKNVIIIAKSVSGRC